MVIDKYVRVCIVFRHNSVPFSKVYFLLSVTLLCSAIVYGPIELCIDDIGIP